MQTDIFAKAREIKLIIFDVDGVLTAGHIYFSNSGDHYKAFHTQDGLGIKLLLANGIEVGVISGNQSLAVEKRMAALGVKFVYQGCDQKISTYEVLRDQLNLKDSQIAYVGDDLPDLSLIQRSGLGIAVANAVEPLHQVANWVTQKAGGQGAAREVSELLLQAQDKLQSAYALYLGEKQCELSTS